MRLGLYCRYIIAGALFLFVLTACSPVYQTTYSYIPPKKTKLRLCTTRCDTNLTACQSSCRAQQSRCNAAQAQENLRADDAAARNSRIVSGDGHKHGKHNHGHSGRALTSQENAAAIPHYMGCDFLQCDCTPGYNRCYTNCGGQVIAHTRCVAFCGKKK